VVDIDASLFHHFFKIAVADAVLAIPADALQDYLALKVPPFEVAHSLLLNSRLNPGRPIYIFRRISNMRINCAERERQ
jgi:hypothetical protein